MKSRVLTIIPIAFALIAASTPVNAQTARVITNPTWLQTPDRPTIDRHFPEAARSSRMQGVAMLLCTATSEGWLENCAITSESPEGFGFGQAALELSTFFRVKPDDSEGKSIAGALVNVPISLPLPESSGPARIAAPPPAPWQLPPGVRMSIITSPDWRTLPSGEDMARAYPRKAWMAGVEGRAVITCAVKKTGRLESCAVFEETPLGAGFGEAAVQLASRFEMKPMTKDGQPVDGGQIKIPILFKLPAPPSPAQ